MFNRIRKFFAKPASQPSRAVESKGPTERKSAVVSKKRDPKEAKP